MKQITGIALSWLVLLTAAQAASFDCAKASTTVEKLICSDAELSKLDEDLNKAYLRSLERDDVKQQAIKRQRQWLKNERNVCQNVACIKAVYESRISESSSSIPPKQRISTAAPDLSKKLSKDQDALETLSLIRRRRPPTGSLVTLFAKDKTLCEQFASVTPSNLREGDNTSPSIGLPGQAVVIESNKTLPYEYNGNYQQYSFDINNDGKDETVVGLHARTHAQDGDTFYVFSDNVVPNPVVERVGDTRSELVYAKAATWILPQFWFKGARPAENELADKNNINGFYEVRSVGSPWWDNNDKPIFRFRYWYLLPFRYEETTYFLTWSQDGRTQHWYTVLRPEPSYQVTEMCVFQVVQESH